MSHVLDFIITASILEEEDDPETPEDTIYFQLVSPRMKELQTALNDLVKDKGYELSKDIPARRVDYFNGGNAAMQNRVYLGASRHICPEQLRQAVLKVQWKSPDEVRVFICDENWSAFAPLPLDKPYLDDKFPYPLDLEEETLAEKLAKKFHETYEELAPSFGYETRKESAKPWAEVPEQNKDLMIAVAGKILEFVVRELQ